MITTTRNEATTAKVMALGFLLAALMAASLVLAEGRAHASTTFTVNSTEDHADANLGLDGCDTGYDLPGTSVPECTLRAALNEANYTDANPGADIINFAIPGSGVKTIAPESALPVITEAVSINGYTQPGATPNTLAKGTNAKLLIELEGSKLSTPHHGLAIGASNSTIKGLVINRFGNSGINITDNPSPTPVGNRIEGNFIGTDPSGTQDLPGNGDDGITIDDSSSNKVGGTSLASRNLISGNTDGGVYISSGNQVRGNLIGTKKDGITPLGDGTNGGVRIEGMSSIVAGNTIASNLGAGVAVVGVNGNRILSNSIFANGGLGIDLYEDGPTANDTGDADAGPNDLQNKPIITSAKNADGKTAVRGKLNSSPHRTFVVQLFSNPSGADEGKVFIGQKSVETDGSGNVTFAFSPAQRVALGRTITATATSPAGDTSEFSAPRTVVSA